MVMQEKHKDLSWFRQEKALRPTGGGDVSIILHLSAPTGVNTSRYCGWMEMKYGGSSTYVSCPLSLPVPPLL